MTETEFNDLVDDTLIKIEEGVDASGVDIECETATGILTLEFTDGSKIIVNRHVPNREIWVAAKSGGFHFRADHGHWRDTRGHDDLATALTRLLKSQAHVALRLPDLPAPQER